MKIKTLAISSLLFSHMALAIDNNEYSQTNGIHHIYNPGHKYVVIMRHEQTSGLYTGRTEQEARARAEAECRKMPGYCEFETCTGADGVWAARANSAEYTQDGGIKHTIGIVCGSPTMEAAIREAERTCRNEGGASCKVNTIDGYHIAKIEGNVNEFGGSENNLIGEWCFPRKSGHREGSYRIKSWIFEAPDSVYIRNRGVSVTKHGDKTFTTPFDNKFKDGQGNCNKDLTKCTFKVCDVSVTGSDVITFDCKKWTETIAGKKRTLPAYVEQLKRCN